LSSNQQLTAKNSFNEDMSEGFVNANVEPCLVFLNELLNDVYSNKCVTCLREIAFTEIEALF